MPTPEIRAETYLGRRLVNIIIIIVSINLLDIRIAVGMALGGSAGGLVDAVSQDDLVDGVRQAVDGLGEHGVGPAVGPGHELHEEVGGVDGDGPEHHHPRLPGDPLVCLLFVKPQPPHRPVLST